ncbi:MAG: hypothetical protein H3C47_10425 [Candidatus Cloacimonetes bacterium]|nr:hypothetical protein [Candidatus Cloacimonadota bacterium]
MQPFDTIDWDLLAQDELQFGNLALVLGDLGKHFREYHASGPKNGEFEQNWLRTMASCINTVASDQVLDIGSGFAPIASYVLAQHYTCVETEPACVDYLKSKGLVVIPKPWMDCQSLPVVDHVFCIRALGVVSLNSDNRLCLSESLEKMTACARKKVHVVMRNFRWYEPLEAELRGIGNSGFAKDPYLFPLPLLLQLGYTPDLKWFTWTSVLEFNTREDMLNSELKNVNTNLMKPGAEQDLSEYLLATSQMGSDGKVLRTATYKNYILQWGKAGG